MTERPADDPPEGSRPWWSRQWTVEQGLGLIARNPIGAALAAGVLFRLGQFLAGRSLWMDEQSLASNLQRKSLIGLFGPLASTQLAPPGFLVVQKLAESLGADSKYGLRVLPLLAAIASLWLFLTLARRLLRPGGVWVALALFAVADDLIYFASELKQYSTDVAVALVCWLMGLDLLDRPATGRRIAGAAALGAAAAWLSHPSILVLAGVGTVLLARGVWDRGPRGAVAPALLGLAWLASFAAVYAVGLEQLGHRRDMWVFWDFAFPPRPPASLWDASWPIRRLLYFFVNPLEFSTPLGPLLSIAPAVGLCGAGMLSLGRRDRAGLALLVLPAAYAMVAAALRLYPFHGRLILFLVPAALLLIGEGAGWAGDRLGPGWPRTLLLGGILLFPTLTAAYHLASPRERVDLNPYGDRRSKAIDPYWFPLDPPDLKATRPGPFTSPRR